jgi:hypothetical protein
MGGKQCPRSDFSRLQQLQRRSELAQRGLLRVAELVGRADIGQYRRSGPIGELVQHGGELLFIHAEASLKQLVQGSCSAVVTPDRCGRPRADR